MTPAEMAALHLRAFTAPRPWTESEFSDMLASPHVFAVNAPGGLGLGRAAAGEAEVLTLAVAPEMRRRGIGRRLLESLEAEARQRGAERMLLDVAEDNTAARELYHAAGYRHSGRRRGYFRAAGREAVDALVLEKALVPE